MIQNSVLRIGKLINHFHNYCDINLRISIKYSVIKFCYVNMIIMHAFITMIIFFCVFNSLNKIFFYNLI